MDRLSQTGLDLLLACLHSDRQEAGARYELLRRKLLKFFEWRGCFFPEDAVDETFNRIAKNLEAGEQIRNVAAFALGIARNVLLEALRDQRHEELPEELVSSPTTQSGDAERQFACLERCLKKLAPEEATLVLQYYESDRPSHIASRKQLAEKLGIPMNALRIRTHRIRSRLEVCVERCIKEDGTR